MLWLVAKLIAKTCPYGCVGVISEEGRLGSVIGGLNRCENLPLPNRLLRYGVQLNPARRTKSPSQTIAASLPLSSFSRR